MRKTYFPIFEAEFFFCKNPKPLPMKKKSYNVRTLSRSLLVFVLSFASLMSSGQTLVDFNAAILSGISPQLPYNSVTANLNSTAITRSSLTSATATAGFGSSSWPTTASAPTSAKFLTFTLTATAAHVINLGGATLSFGISRSGVGPTIAYIYSSVSGYSSTANVLNTTTPIASLPTVSTVNYVFPSTGAYDNLSTVTIHIYADVAGSSAGILYLKNPSSGNIRISGGSVTSCIPVFSLISSNSPICSGSTLNLTSTATSGITPITYSWSGPNGFASSSQNPSIPSATTAAVGTYSVTASNSCGTSPSSTTNVAVSSIVMTALSQTNISCNNGSNGSASVNTASGGQGSYTYNWTPGNPIGDGTTTVSGLTVGTYTCNVTDGIGCMATQPFNITQPSAIALTLNGTNATCANNDGSATVSASGGAGGYTYLWMPGASTSANPTGLSAATYTCTVTDINSCSNSGTVLITAASVCLTQLNAASCGATLTALNQPIYCNAVAGATNYQYTFKQGATTVALYTRGNYLTNCILSTIPSLQYAQTYQVTVSSYVGGNWSSFGPSCNVTTPAFPAGHVSAGSCGITLTSLATPIYCNTVIGATNYEWKFMQGATLIGTYQRGNWLTDITPTNVNSLSYGQSYDVYVRAQEGGIWGPFGTSCALTTPAFPSTQVGSTWCNSSVTNLSSGISCNIVLGATNYQWKAEKGAFSSIVNRGSNLNNWRLSWNVGTTINTTYNVSVRAMVGGVWGTFGPVCTIYVGPNLLPQFPGDNIVPSEVRLANPDVNFGSDESSISVFPNPFSENITVTTDADVQSLSIYNSFGELVRMVEIKNGTAEISLGDLANGIYLIQAKTANGMLTKRVIKQ